MFAVLDIDKYEGGFLKAVSRFFVKKDAEITHREVQGGKSFFEIKVYETSSGVDWEEVKWCAGVCADRLLVPQGVEIPYSSGVYKFVPKKLPLVMIFNNAVEIISKVSTDKNFSVAVFDKIGALASKVDVLLNFARHLTVYTDDATLYSSATQRIMDNFGAAVIVLPYESECDESNIIIADRYNENRMSNAPIVFCAEKLSCYSNLIFGNNMTLCGQYMKSKPPKIDAFDFVSALYEMNSFDEIGDLMFSQLYIGGEECSSEKVTGYIDEKVKSL